MIFVIWMIWCLLVQPYSMESTLRPDLFVTKQPKVIGDDLTMYQVNITVQHTQDSLNDAFSVEILDIVREMDIISIYILPRTHSSKMSFLKKGSFDKWNIIGNISLLKLGESVSMVYQTSFLRNDVPVTSSSSRAMVNWTHGPSNNPKFGPIYSNSTCVIKNLQDKTSFVKNYGFIILGVILGIVLGCFVACLIVLCLRRYPSAKHYILHTDESVGIHTTEEPIVTKVSVCYDDNDMEDEQKESDDHNVFVRFVNALWKKEETDCVDNANLPTDLMWLSPFFKGNVNDASDKLNKFFEPENASLLVFTLDLWTYIWKSNLYFHVSRLSSDGRIDLETKEKCFESLHTLFKPIDNWGELNNSKETDEFIESVCDIIMKIVHQSIDFYEDLLDSNIKIRHAKGTYQTRDPDLLKQIKKKREGDEERERQELKKAYLNKLHKDISEIFVRLFEALHCISCVVTDIRLHATSNTALLVILEQSVDVVNSWIRHTSMKYTDTLKRKRLLPDYMDVSYQEIFQDELKQVISYLALKKEKLIERYEASSLTSYLVRRGNVMDDYSKILETLLPGTSGNQRDVADTSIADTTENILSKFNNSELYGDSLKHALDENMFTTIHTDLLRSFSQPLNVFFSRMKTHVHDIFNTKLDTPELINDFGSLVGDPIELCKIAETNHLSRLISNIEERSVELLVKISQILEKDAEFIQECGVEFREVHNRLLTKKKSKIFGLMNDRWILLKCILQCHAPLLWENCMKVIEKSPKLFLTLLCSSNLTYSIFPNYDLPHYTKEIARIRNESFEMFTSSILKKFELINKEVLSEIQHIYDIAKDGMENVTKNSSENSIQNNQRETFLDLFIQSRKLKQQVHILNLTCKYIFDIFMQLEGTDPENDGELIENMNNFRKKSKKILSLFFKTMTDESEEELKSKINCAFTKFMSICKIFVSETEEIPTMMFNIDEMTSHMFEIGKQHKLVEDKISLVTDLIIENQNAINKLIEKNVMSQNQLYMYLKDLSLCLSDIELNSAHKIILLSTGAINDLSINDIFIFFIKDIDSYGIKKLRENDDN